MCMNVGLKLVQRNQTKHFSMTRRVSRSHLSKMYDVWLLQWNILEIHLKRKARTWWFSTQRSLLDLQLLKQWQRWKRKESTNFRHSLECIVERTKTLNDTIPRNKLLMFSTSTVKRGMKQKGVSLKQDTLSSKLFIACQTRGGNLKKFFLQESQPCPPALSDGDWRVICLQAWNKPLTVQRLITCIIIDGAALIRILINQVQYKPSRNMPIGRLLLMWAEILKVCPGLIWCGNATCLWKVPTIELFVFLSNALLRLLVQEGKQLVVPSHMEASTPR